MTVVTQHAPGTFCWPELGTSDQAGAKKFYSSLFGWGINDMTMPEGTYTIFRLKDKDCAACYTLNPKMQAGVPPHWGAYVSVENADQTAKRAAELGGKVVAEAFDVMGIGRMAILQDPTGGTFCAWQPITHIGAGILGEPGAMCWTELMTTDPAKAGAFYRALIGWKSTDMPMQAGSTYTVYERPDGTKAAGMMAMPPQMKGVPSNWLTYFHVTDIRATTAKATSLGAKVAVPPTPIPNVGEFAVFQDPQGATFAVLQPAM